MKLPGFCLQMIRWDGMHVINLGVDLWVCGSVIKKLVTYDDMFGGSELAEADRLMAAYDMFRNWSRTNRVRSFSCYNIIYTIFKFYPRDPN